MATVSVIGHSGRFSEVVAPIPLREREGIPLSHELIMSSLSLGTKGFVAILPRNSFLGVSWTYLPNIIVAWASVIFCINHSSELVQFDSRVLRQLSVHCEHSLS